MPDQFVEAKYDLRRLVGFWGALAAFGCGASRAADSPAPALPLPVSVMLGVEVVVYPLTMILGEAELGWDDVLSPRDSALRVADSLLAKALTERTPEVTWVLPAELRRIARGAPGLLIDPDRMATATLRHNLAKIPDPLRSQMRARPCRR